MSIMRILLTGGLGDIDEIYASTEKAKMCLDWVATRTLEDICKDGYRFTVTSSIITSSQYQPD